MSVMRCLEKDPARRWSAAELRDSLKDGANVEMPEDLRVLESLGAYSLLLLCLGAALSPFEIFFWSQVGPGGRLILELVQFTGLLGAGLTVAAAAAARKAQRPWPLIVRTIFRPPQWYIGVVDVYDALRTARPYKPALSAAHACDELAREVARGWRRADLVDVFVALVREETR